MFNRNVFTSSTIYHQLSESLHCQQTTYFRLTTFTNSKHMIAGNNADRVKLLYEGVKIFNDGAEFDIMVLEHTYCNTIEVIIENDDFTAKCYRLYINASVIHSKVNMAEVQNHVRNVARFSGISSSTTESGDMFMMQEVFDAMLIQLILLRLSVFVNYPFAGSFRVTIDGQMHQTMRTDFVPVLETLPLQLACTCPPSLEPYQHRSLETILDSSQT